MIYRITYAKIGLVLLSTLFYGIAECQNVSYPIVDTDVTEFYDNESVISAPSVGLDFYGQDASYNGNQPSYTDNNNGTVTDNVTGLMWQQVMGDKIAFSDAFAKADTMTLGNHTDWRVPSLKELYSLILFSGRVLGENVVDKFIDTVYFDQPIGNTALNEREIDAQTWSSTEYIGLTMGGDVSVFGVNFLDGRIKAYPRYQPPQGVTPRTMYFRMVRGNSSYGVNGFINNNDGTITDSATGLMWQQADDGSTRDWEDALSYAEGLSLAGHSDWRLPNAKELQSIVDYGRSPDSTSSAAIDPVFSATSFSDPDGNSGQYGYYWTGSPMKDGPNPYKAASYVAFGEAQGNNGNGIMDAHGAGAARSDPKTGDSADYPQYHGPQGDVQYVFNYVRAVRDVSDPTGLKDELNDSDLNVYPNPVKDEVTIASGSAQKLVSFYNSMGELLFELQPKRNSVTIDTSELEGGEYFISVMEEKATTVHKIVVVK